MTRPFFQTVALRPLMETIRSEIHLLDLRLRVQPPRTDWLRMRAEAG